jgi:hypothetical protein
MKNSRIVIVLLVLAVVVVGAALVYLYTQPPGPGAGPGRRGSNVGLVYLDNGLDMAARAEFYHLAEGSEIYPVLWMQALKVKKDKNDPAKDEKYFLDIVESLGFLADPDNDDGLPVGLTSGVTRGLEALGPMSGLNCAACHVGELHHDGKRVRIDGAPNLLNTRLFFITLIESALDTAAKPAKLVEFVAKVHELEEKKKKTPPSKLAALGRKVLVSVVKKEEEAFDALLKPALDDIIKKEFASPRFSFKQAIQDGIKDEQAFHAKIVETLKLPDLGELVKASNVLKGWEQEAERRLGLTHLLEDIYVKLRLLRARAEFLKKLGMVGNDDRTDWGPGRVDAFGSARAFLFQDGYVPLNPVSYPPIFELKSHNWFHYDNNTNTFLERNFGQALGVGAVWDENSKSYSLEPKNLRRLEALAHQLSAPTWKEAIFGKIDQERAKRGKELYATFCAKCHDADKNDQFNTLDKLKDINTDPARATMFNEEVPKDKVRFPIKIRGTLAKIKEVALKEFNDAEKAEIEKEVAGKPEWRGPTEYSARTLKGAWATAPYLHNGSVPTLDDLLQPAKDRPKKFTIGSRKFDVQKLGYLHDDKAAEFDTTKPGNSNAGHEGKAYGTEISPEQRKDLLEYLKTL